MCKQHTVYSVCGMCGVRCPIAVDVEDGQVRWIYGNPHSALQGALCARGAAGIALETDTERPQSPLIRVGERGAGHWKAVSWGEALDYVARRLKECAHTYGPENLLWSDRDGPFIDLPRAFVRGMGSPNVCSHSVSCDINAHHGGKAVTGIGRGMLTFDYAHCKHLVLQGRNLFEAINVGECLSVTRALRDGCRLSVIDVRPTITASKAHDYFGLRPGSDYAFNVAVIHILTHEDGLCQKDYVNKHTTGFEKLRAFVRPFSPEWAEKETGIAPSALRSLVYTLAEAAPHVIWHPGWMTTRYTQSFQVSRTAFVINALLGSIGTRGGIIPSASPSTIGRKDLQKFSALYPAPHVVRVDGVGSTHKAFDAGKGLLHHCFASIQSGKPYPIKSYIAWRHDPLQAMPDPEAIKRIFNNLDLLVSVTFSWSDTAWYSDVVLPLSPYLSRESIIATKNGLKPQFFVRQRAVQPTYDTRADWEIISGLAQRCGLDKLVFNTIDDVWGYQLKGTGITMADFAATGFMDMTNTAQYPDMTAFTFPTPSGTLELTSAGWEAATNIPMLTPYVPPPAPPHNAFRIIFGRVAVHTQGHTINNPLLHEQMPCNSAWIHPSRAKALNLVDGQEVEVLASNGACAGRVPLHVAEGIHPEALFMVHGFGHRLPCESRALGKGAADQELLIGGLIHEDTGGGGLALQEYFVTLRPVVTARGADL